MRTLFGLGLCAALLRWAAVPAEAQLLKNFKANGEIEVQGRSISNATDLNNNNPDYTGQVGTLVLLGMRFDLIEGASARISLYKNNRAWGTPSNGIGLGETLTDVEKAVWVSEVNIELASVLGADHTIGRQYLGDPGDVFLRLGPTEDYVFGLPVYGVDAWRAQWRLPKSFALSAVVGKLASSNTFGQLPPFSTDTDVDLHGIKAAWTRHQAAQVQAQVYEIVVNSNPGPAANPFLHPLNTHTIYLNARVKGRTLGSLHYSGEFLADLGQSPSVKGNSSGSGPIAANADGFGFLGKADYTADVGAGDLALKGEVGYGTGTSGATPARDTTLRTPFSDYRPGIIWGGLSELAGTGAGQARGLGGYNNAGLSGDGMSGLITFNAGAFFSPARAERLSVGPQFYLFSQAVDTSPAQTGKSLGTELDATATWKQSDNIKLRLGYGWFIPGNTLKTAVGGSDMIKMGMADVVVKFD